ncbi:hypothetical protein B0H12DRAFT_1158690 [Mycena haematopus]|nr:hypothetical protein B0H12DRAFT_1158690 [Mycena haematopus]
MRAHLSPKIFLPIFLLLLPYVSKFPCFSLSRPCKRITDRDIIVEDPRHEDELSSLEIGAIYNPWPKAYGCCEQRCSRAYRSYSRYIPRQKGSRKG